MATFRVDAVGTMEPASVSFEDLWSHYERSGLLYDAKRSRLAPLLPTISAGWPVALAAPDDVVRILVSSYDSDVRSSHAAFRDTECSFVVHSAASEDYALGFRRCLIAQLSAFAGMADIAFGGTFYRPENRWTRHIVDVISGALGPGYWSQRQWAYLTACPRTAPSPATTPQALLAEGPMLDNCGQFISAFAGPLRAACLGLAPGDPNEQRLAARYAAAGLMHGRRMWYVERHGRIAGLAVRRMTDVPLNLSLLDRRAEILVDPDAADRNVIVCTLAEALLADAAMRDEVIFPLLVEASDVDAAVAAGFDDTKTVYNDVLWQSSGIERAVDALRTLYARIDAREARRSQSAVAKEPVS